MIVDMARAIALFSGGLDSALAILTVLRQGVDVTAITFLTHFGCDITDRSSCSKNPFPVAEKFNFEVKLCHLADKFLEIVKNPKYGHGRNMNPCIDCRILMLKEAKELMTMVNADFIVTGEVLGQRPMSQRRDSFPLIDREAGVERDVLRPLSAKLMKPTIPEINGLVCRDKLYDFSGRSRKPQIALAREFGLTDYPAPAGGCLLTEPNYSHRLKELLKHNPDPSLNELHLLRVGRHFRFSSECKIIVGRDKEENKQIESLASPHDYLLSVEGYGSPITIVTGKANSEAINIAASLCARYSDAKNLTEIEVIVSKNNISHRLKVRPADNKNIECYRIEKTVMRECVMS
jgi:tRNA U34 2-thiouridine synthase MnmA/TrmU